MAFDPTTERIWPDKINLRDTGLHDDMGGGGQRIYTNAGRGYERKEYTRTDLILPMIDAAVAEAVEKSAGVAAKQIHAYGWKASWHPSHVNGIVRDTLAAIRALIPKKSVKEDL